MMKKLVCVLLCLMLVIPSALADTPAKRLAEADGAYEWLYDTSLSMAAVFDEALRNDDYIAFVTKDFPPFIEFDPNDVARIRMQDYTQPLDVTIVRADDLLSAYSPDSDQAKLALIDPLPAMAASEIRGLYLSGAGSLFDPQSSDTEYYLATALGYSDAFPRPAALEGPCFAMLQYGGLYAFLVAFYPTDNGVVFAYAQLIPSRAADALNLPKAAAPSQEAEWLLLQSLRLAHRLPDAVGFELARLVSVRWTEETAQALSGPPEKARIYTLREDSVKTYFSQSALADGVSFDDLSPRLQAYLGQAALAALPSDIWGRAMDNAFSDADAQPTLPWVKNGLMTLGEAAALYAYTRDAMTLDKPEALTAPAAVYLEFSGQTAVMVLCTLGEEQAALSAAVIPACDPLTASNLSSLFTEAGAYTADELAALGR